VLVTGGNSGIGLALCTQLARDHGCRVFLGSRDAARGAEAVASIVAERAALAASGGSVELVSLDVTDAASVRRGVGAVEAALAGASLAALVNNAGVGLGPTDTGARTVDTNLLGARRVTEAALPLLARGAGRVVNVGSGAGPGYVRGLPARLRPPLCGLESSLPDPAAPAPGDAAAEAAWWDHVGRYAAPAGSTPFTRSDPALGLGGGADGNAGYGLSKALLSLYTLMLSRRYPDLSFSCVSPGFIDTKLVRAAWPGATGTKPPEQGTVSVLHCLRAPECAPGAALNGRYWGSDGVLSPYHFMRSPGTEPYDGVVPTAEDERLPAS